jgi:hypothetical protein
MEYKVFKTHLLKTIKWYEEELTKRHGPLALSPAMAIKIEQDFETLVAYKKTREPTTSWQIPLKLRFFDDGRFEIELVDPNRITYLDNLCNNKP